MPILLVVLIVVLIDQFSKNYILVHMLPGMSIPVIQDIFHITYVLNPGAAFGLFEHQTLFFLFVAVSLVGAAIYFYPRIPKQYGLLRFGTGLLVGGAIGNVIDRIKTGYVVDFFDFRIWPVFNIADTAIVCGVGCIIFTMIYLYKEDEIKND
ncbi:signal peptidase II [Pelosinus sp. UFO1]|uniref:signal peptidase II n=1 Tax=Pelosinus sp. UFO1 TaxID=484770 RepID=UPI0004D19579|nr:signal peptidase II [Pelosinus sp. UFO1]AIF51952.1 Lipoprotein signal peptidase [Pelosinus sp. UFO1]